MTVLIIILSLILLGIVVVQIGRISELAGRIRGEEDARRESNFWNARLLFVFGVVLIIFSIGSAWFYKNSMLGYGPHQSASEHGLSLDFMFDITLLITGIVFVITQAVLFYFSYRYRDRKGVNARFISHDNKLEILWTAIPAVVMTILVIYGLDVWNDVMTDIDRDEDVIQVEATGMQFAWLLRYPGPDGELGATDYKNISGVNPLGQIWKDPRNLDDFQPNQLVLPVDKKVRVRIGSRDVLHNFYLPHFRVKMDAVPGMPTFFIFTPTKTTEEYRQQLKEYPEYQQPANPDDPEGPKRWETFNYELACAELCGKGHYSMRKQVRIVSQKEYKKWQKEQSSYYMSTIRGSDNDPYKGEFIENEKQKRKEELEKKITDSLQNDSASVMIPLQYIEVEQGMMTMDESAEKELEMIGEILQKYDNVTVVLHPGSLKEGDGAVLIEALEENGVPRPIQTASRSEEQKDQGVRIELKSR